MSMTYERALLEVARAYSAAVNEQGGKSLARVATIVVNRGSFFDRLENGDSFSVRNLDRMASYFRDPSNWPGGSVPPEALAALLSIGRPAIASLEELAGAAEGRKVRPAGAPA